MKIRKIGGIHYITIGRLCITWSVKRKPKPVWRHGYLVKPEPVQMELRGVLRRPT